MSFDFAQVKASARRSVHEMLGVRAFYSDNSVSEPVEIVARWHSKIERFGDLESQSYAEYVQGIDRVIFEAAVARQLNMRRGGIVSFPDYGAGLGASLGAPLDGQDVGPPAFILDVREPVDGPFEEIWQVTRKETP